MSGEDQGGLPTPRRWFAVFALSLVVALTVLVNAGVAVALPSLGTALGISRGQAVWVASAYQLAVAVALLPSAAWADRVGHLRVYRVGLALFLVASAACASAPGLATLLLARTLQGVGAAGAMAVNIALLRVVYPPTHLGRGVGFNAMVVALASAAGPSVGGFILTIGSWRWLFAGFAVLAALAFLAGRRVLIEPPQRAPARPYDLIGVVLQALVVGGVIVGIGLAGHRRQGLSGMLLLVGSVALGVVFARRELTRREPMLPLDLLARPMFALSLGASVASFVAQMLTLVALPFALLRNGISPGQLGFVMMPWPLAVAVVAPLSGTLSDRISTALLGSSGLAIAALALLAMPSLQSGSDALSWAWRVAACGLGFGIFSAPNVRTLVAATPPSRSAAAGAMIAMARQFGQALGTSIAGAIFLRLDAQAAGTCFTSAAAACAVAFALSALRGRFKG